MGKGMHLFTQGPRVRSNPNPTLVRAYRVWLSSTLSQAYSNVKNNWIENHTQSPSEHESVSIDKEQDDGDIGLRLPYCFDLQG